MKENLSKALDLFFESLYFLVITYTLHSMYASFRLYWYAVLFFSANLFTIAHYYGRVVKITGSKLAAVVALITCWVLFACLACSVGYIHGEFTAFPSL